MKQTSKVQRYICSNNCSNADIPIGADSKQAATQRIRKASDLAKKADSHGYRCIDSDGKGNITLVKPDGTFTTHKAYQQDGEGYVPVIKVNLKKCNIHTE